MARGVEFCDSSSSIDFWRFVRLDSFESILCLDFGGTRVFFSCDLLNCSFTVSDRCEFAL